MVDRSQSRISNPAIGSCLGPWEIPIQQISASHPYYSARYQKRVFSYGIFYLRFYWTKFHEILWGTWYRHCLFVENFPELLVHFSGGKAPLNFSLYRLNMLFWSDHPNEHILWCIGSPFWTFFFQNFWSTFRAKKPPWISHYTVWIYDVLEWPP